MITSGELAIVWQAGWDPMFHDFAIASALRVPPAHQQGQHHPVHGGIDLFHDPGTTYAYSNYGYLLLGRVIERVTGQDYAQYAASTILGPLGMRNVRLGRSEAAFRAPGEVTTHRD